MKYPLAERFHAPQGEEKPLRRRARLDLSGQRFGKLVATEPRRRPNGQYAWSCRCDCGNVAVVATNKLTSRHNQSCGCGIRDAVLRRNRLANPSTLPPGVGAARELLRNYKKNIAAGRDLAWGLTDDAALVLFSGTCHYCGVIPSQVAGKSRNNGAFFYNGIDRLDNAVGYVVGNVVSCCGVCNHAKHMMPYEKFCDWLRRVAEFWKTAREEMA